MTRLCLLCMTKCFYMCDENQSIDSLQEVKDIRRMMERSSRFISLSGWSGVAAGVIALIGAAFARFVILENYSKLRYNQGYLTRNDLEWVQWQLIFLALAVFVAASLSAYYFTWRKTSEQGTAVWNPTSRRMFWNMAIPIVAGGLFIFEMLRYEDWRFVAPASMIFYGLGLINASKYTLSDIRYLGFCEIALGLINMEWIGYGLYFWAIGFGVLHIIYGIVMWWKYERKP